MKRQGAEIVDPADLPSHGKYGRRREFEVLQYEFKTDLNDVPGGRERSRSYAGETHRVQRAASRAEEMPYFEQEIFEESQKRGPLTDPAYRKALESEQRLARAEGIDAAVDQISSWTPSWRRRPGRHG